MVARGTAASATAASALATAASATAASPTLNVAFSTSYSTWRDYVEGVTDVERFSPRPQSPIGSPKTALIGAKELAQMEDAADAGAKQDAEAAKRGV